MQRTQVMEGFILLQEKQQVLSEKMQTFLGSTGCHCCLLVEHRCEANMALKGFCGFIRITWKTKTDYYPQSFQFSRSGGGL